MELDGAVGVWRELKDSLEMLQPLGLHPVLPATRLVHKVAVGFDSVLMHRKQLLGLIFRPSPISFGEGTLEARALRIEACHVLVRILLAQLPPGVRLPAPPSTPCATAVQRRVSGCVVRAKTSDAQRGWRGERVIE